MRHIAISGELGSGKSVVAAALAEELGAEVVSTGAIHRQIAASRGESALETNLAAEDDEAIDRQIDGELVRRAASEDTIVFDSRMAWHFVPHAMKVHLVVDPAVGAARMLGRSPTAVERYADVEEATARAEERHASEQRRFLGKYEVDIDRLRNYDVVVDTSVAPVEEIAAWIGELYARPEQVAAGPVACVAPGRLLSAGSTPVVDDATMAELQDRLSADPRGDGLLPLVAYSRPWFCVLDRDDVVAAAVAAGRPLLRTTLQAEAAEEVAPGRTADALVAEVAGSRTRPAGS